MEYQEFTGKTVSDALTNASVALGVTSDNINYDVIEKGNTGLFGIGSKNAVIRVSLKTEEDEVNVPEAEEVVEAEAAVEPVAEVADEAEVKEEAPVQPKKASHADPAECEAVIREFLEEMFGAMKMEVEINCTFHAEDDSIDVELAGPEMGVIIGKRGQTLDSVQYLTNLALNRKVETYTRVKIDTEDYRARRKATLENLAKNVAFRVKKTRKAATLEPMNPYERRIIHSALQNDKFVETHSEGEEPYRHVVVTLK